VGDGNYDVPWEWTEYNLWRNVYKCTPWELERAFEERLWSEIQTDLVLYNFENQMMGMKR